MCKGTTFPSLCIRSPRNGFASTRQTHDVKYKADYLEKLPFAPENSASALKQAFARQQ
ncbi:hypothetical protein EMIT0P258_170024 [Pseudomonas sp. IT-P258]